MEDSRNSTSSQRLSGNFDTPIESPEADITAIPVVRPEFFPTSHSGNIPVSVQELVYGRKEAGVGTSSKSLDRHKELLSSSGKVHGPRKYWRPSEGLETHVLQRKILKDKSLVEKPKSCVRGPEERVFPKEGQQPSGSSSSLQKQEYTSKSSKKVQESPKEKSAGKAKGKGKGKVHPQNYRIKKK
ncbi:hypothetical protein O181_109513 [Austropuccinia psidii MF-1]|uniref:Uncharacterized protein n=1 Tax=Austropuccinia psidii MF-1 TaxID=1389203 RepID=A0A9Q3JUW8_9BASI|nr:hypothetical protein [Austropuccinia psidii MF-1]